MKLPILETELGLIAIDAILGASVTGSTTRLEDEAVTLRVDGVPHGLQP